MLEMSQKDMLRQRLQKTLSNNIFTLLLFLRGFYFFVIVSAISLDPLSTAPVLIPSSSALEIFF